MLAIAALALAGCHGRALGTGNERALFDRETKRLSLSGLAAATGMDPGVDVNIRRFHKATMLEMPLEEDREQSLLLTSGGHRMAKGWVSGMTWVYRF